MGRVFAFLKKELLEMLPPTIFFFVVFHVVVLARSLVGDEGGFSMNTSAAATVGALIVGKSILVADALPLFHWFSDRRLIYNVVWRVLLYASVVLAFQVVEELVSAARKYGGLGAAGERLVGEIDWPRFWATHLLLLVFLAFYSVVTAFVQVLGRDRVLEIFLGRRQTRASG